MAKVITFSRTFPAYHPKKGQPTYFVEEILSSLNIDYRDNSCFIWLVENNPEISERFLDGFFNSLCSKTFLNKFNTIRANKIPINVGDFLNPMCWAGSHLIPKVNPYKKTLDGYWKIKFAPDIEIKKVWDIEIDDNFSIFINRNLYAYSSSTQLIDNIAHNDGLDHSEFYNWFIKSPEFKKNKSFRGQIICWNENIEY